MNLHLLPTQTNSPMNLNSAQGDGFLWSAPAERSGDGAFGGGGSLVRVARRPKRCRALLATALHVVTRKPMAQVFKERDWRSGLHEGCPAVKN